MTMMSARQQFRSFGMGYKAHALNFTLVALSASYVLYLALTRNIFSDDQASQQAPETLETDELLLVVGVLVVGLMWALGRLLRERRETARRATAEREIRFLAYHDGLTSLPNRRFFTEALSDLVKTPLQAGSSHGVLLLDLNDFKKINDQFGHAAGDQVLIEIARRLSNVVGESGFIARLGGDEFAILVPQIDAAFAMHMCQRLLQQFEPSIMAGQANLRVGSAIGIALLPESGLSGEDLLRQADLAMYEAKRRPCSTAVLFEQSMDMQAMHGAGVAGPKPPESVQAASLERAIDHTLAARRAICSGDRQPRASLLAAVDILLIELGHQVAAAPSRRNAGRVAKQD